MDKEKPIRKLRGYYWYVNLEWIKREIVKSYLNLNKDEADMDDKNMDDNMKRKLIISKSLSNYHNRLGYYFFALQGSPPKGCAIYAPHLNTLLICSVLFKVKRMKNIQIIGFEDEGDDIAC